MRINPARLPLKVVPQLQSDFYRPKTGGSEKKVFRDTGPEFRRALVSQVREVKAQFSDSFSNYPGVPAVARVRVRKDAIAKVHRPTRVFSDDTCPIIGTEAPGEMLLTVTPRGLDRLADVIHSEQTKEGIANLSTLLDIEPVRAVVDPLVAKQSRAKVKLFRHSNTRYDDTINRTFKSLISKLGLPEAKELRYGPGLKVYSVESSNPETLTRLAGFAGVQSIGPFPIYQPVRTTSLPVRALNPDDFPAPLADVDYPLVGIIDSGTRPNDPFLGPWVVNRAVYVPEAEQNNDHGSFVAGLIVHAQHLNHRDPRFPSCSAKIVDVVALVPCFACPSVGTQPSAVLAEPLTHLRRGALGPNGATEDELLSIIEESLIQFPTVRVWNLSFGSGALVSDARFSDFAVTLDALQDEYNVIFVLAAGNYLTAPYRTWPPNELHGEDRLCAPADSIRSLVVAAHAHRSHPSARVKEDEPSPFSRRGPGPLYLPKPEVSHIGGNCSATGDFGQVGVLSVNANGCIAEDVGTSFSAPLISTLTANLVQEIQGTPTLLLARALLVHSAAVERRKSKQELHNYRGFGTPPDLADILGCYQWQCTLVFELEIDESVSYQKTGFPLPPSLIGLAGDLRSEIVMTLASSPGLDATFSSEYCRSNVKVSLGTYATDKDGNRKQVKQVWEEPKLKGSSYEADLIKNGFKWSPTKVFRRRMDRGVKGSEWRLNIAVEHRSNHTPVGPLKAVLVVTISDPKQVANVYDEMVIRMNQLGWAAVDLQLRSRLRAS